MRIVEIVARYLLGIIVTVFGLNGFLNFILQPPPPNPSASQFSSRSMHPFLGFLLRWSTHSRIASAL